MAENILETTAGPNPIRRRSREADEQLAWVLASQDGDTVAFNRLVILWQQRIFNLCLRMLRDPDEASEAAQETFMQAYRSVGRFRLESRFSTWLYRIASNQCLTRLRRRPANRQFSIDEDDEIGTMAQRLASQDDQEGDLLLRERRLRVRKALGGLPAEQRIVVELKFFQECTFEEIAAILEKPLSTVKSRFYTGLQGLKRRLAERAR